MEEEVEKLKAEIERLKTWNRWFYGRVKTMREMQKGYFRSRSQDKLVQSKAVEAEVDKEIQRIEAIKIKRSEPVQYLIEQFDAVEVNRN